MILNRHPQPDHSEREARLSCLIDTLRAKGNRMTPQREVILRALVFSDRHPAMDDLFREVRLVWPNISLATVYKVIDMLKQHGQVLEISSGASGSRYDGFRPHDHPHMICTACGAIADLPVPVLAGEIEKVARGCGYQVEQYRFDLYGKCPQCQASDQGADPMKSSYASATG